MGEAQGKGGESAALEDNSSCRKTEIMIFLSGSNG